MAVRRLWWLWVGCVLVLLGGVGVFFLAGFDRGSWHGGDSLPRLWEVPDFALIERSGQPITRAALLGKVWIASVIFTRCTEECPLVSHHMARLQDAFTSEPDVRLVSITVDPEHDTPEVLARYAQNFAAQPQRWLFLTGDKATIYALVRQGFRLGLVDPREAVQSSAVPEAGRWLGSLWPWLTPRFAMAHHGAHPDDTAQQAITHSARLVLVDRQSQVRYLYNSTDQQELHRIPRDVRLVLQGH